MCGVNGIFAYRAAADPPAERELIATRDRMAARGPDGAGAWWTEDRRCGLGHRRLAIQDPTARADQPMRSEDGRYVIVFNGQIYNHPQLRAELEREGVRYRTTCDTETLLHLYARRGPDMVRTLRGMFAFAIWDGARRGLFLARDPYGVKPLYTCDDGSSFRFASQVKAILAGGGASRDIDPGGVVGFHLLGSVPEPFTLYRAIRALPAGHTQWVDAAGAGEPTPFVSLPALLAAGAAAPAPLSETHERVRQAVRDSVAAHMLSDVEVGAFLSAGVDSGALLGLMQDAGWSQVRAITLAFEEYEGTAEDEAPLAAATAARYGARHEVRRVGRQAFAADLPAMLEAMDQPSIDGVNTWFVAKAAHEAGLKVAISGLGGDELLAGYPSFVDLPRWRRRFGPLAAIPGAGRFARLVLQAAAPGLVRRNPKAAGLVEYAGSWAGAYLLRRGLFLPYELPSVMDAGMAREGLQRLGLAPRLQALMTPDPGSDVGRVCALESGAYMRNQLLRDADWAGMAHSLEIRPPLVDRVLLEALAPVLPGLGPGVGKAALAAAPRTSLPPEVAVRAKTGFTVPTGAWLTGESGAADVVAAPAPKGLASRRWARKVIGRAGFMGPRGAQEAAASA